MKPMTRRTLIQASGAGALSFMLRGAGAQDAWPSRTIKIVVPFPPPARVMWLRGPTPRH